ncbi:tRNA1(Val) (adenine(37)-N6)-methyltransferase [Filobacillus milosensis]|uniref:tRNA1(Val) (Adenine(37)-N6)-methyltransferase n=1 Tax=Filobacillus milosensis TaxID=94137 RepID=A0A4Y8IJV2_9BACI|nr:tRNA1(Val) (adenine(37)-N6)-methyltransferase [Filobacillus milosensis]TFB21053.1 tRNA1(Val) (adenine(37)-N6)-methyltransferase [Filobacillus milosensis]
MVELKDDERIDYLLADRKRRIIQSQSVFAFSIDAVLLQHFTYLPLTRGKVIDLCTGNGVIPLFLSKRSKVHMTGVELQERLYDMAIRNVKLNDLESQIDILNEDLIGLAHKIGFHRYDLVTCNPPYFKTIDLDKRNNNEHLAIARHEIYCTLDDVLKSCSQLVKSGGKVSIVHRPNRLAEIIEIAKQYKLEPKRMQLVHPKAEKEANIVLLEFIRDGSPEMKVLPPIYIHDHEGNYTEEVAKLLYGEEGSRLHGSSSEKFRL